MSCVLDVFFFFVATDFTLRTAVRRDNSMKLTHEEEDPQDIRHGSFVVLWQVIIAVLVLDLIFWEILSN